MSGSTAPRPERSGRPGDADEVARKRKLAVQIVADGLITLLLRERMEAQRQAAADAAVAEAHAQLGHGPLLVAASRRSSAVSTTRAKKARAAR